MFDELKTAYADRFLVAALGVSLALLCLFIVLWLLRNRAPSPFVRGGRNRQPRLQVLDAAAVDARRRLVLVRRDNVEHLVMIGGPTDIVIESGIGDERAYLSATPVRDTPLQVAADLPPAAQPQPAPAPRALDRMETPVAPAARPEAVPATRPEAPVAARPVTPAPAAAPAPVSAAAVAKAAAPVATPAPVQAPQLRPEPSAEMRAPEAPKVEAAPSPTPRPEPAAPLRDAADLARPEGVRAEPPVLRPVSEVLAQSPSVTAARPEPKPAQPVPPAAPVMQPAAPAPVAVPAPAAAPELRPVEASARFATPAAAAVMAAPFVAPSPEIAPRPAVDLPTIPQSDAADILEAARQRVLSPVSGPSPRSDARADLPSAAPEAAMRSGELSEFERVLEEEMALHLAANDAQPMAPAPFQPLLPETRADRPVVPPMATPVRVDPARPSAAASQEPDLQNEIARIFGEMSADRN
ncbi:flagellar biosynthesis protein FliO [Rhizobium sp. KAs_5_22]|uniref:flagellar biosynthetic protein FliO n=1 Tax=Ciceribacter selenitireducens TaxID=448181 RepID=UPI00048BAD69|nr:flagellar biosynthetic protein FliO [Ciceribacter selenitireducens]PPJ46318.1 flagellar biosynthesis protein FliO [Rhizobium sp. KAs_5_22]